MALLLAVSYFGKGLIIRQPMGRKVSSNRVMANTVLSFIVSRTVHKTILTASILHFYLFS